MRFDTNLIRGRMVRVRVTVRIGVRVGVKVRVRVRVTYVSIPTFSLIL